MAARAAGAGLAEEQVKLDALTIEIAFTLLYNYGVSPSGRALSQIKFTGTVGGQ